MTEHPIDMELVTAETFTWTKFSGERFIFNVTAMREWCELRLPTCRQHFPAGFRDTLLAVNDVHQPRAMALPPAAMRRPPILLHDSEGVVVVDGSHRLWRRLGESLEVEVFLLPWDYAVEHFSVDPAGIVAWKPGGAPTYDQARHQANAKAALAERREP